jgi:hypothetical protein
MLTLMREGVLDNRIRTSSGLTTIIIVLSERESLSSSLGMLISL